MTSITDDLTALAASWRRSAKSYARSHTAWCQKRGKGAVSGRNVSKAMEHMCIDHAEQIEKLLGKK